MAEIVKIKKDGVTQYPITKPECVINENGKSVKDILKEISDNGGYYDDTEIQSKLTELSTEINGKNKFAFNATEGKGIGLNKIPVNLTKGSVTGLLIDADNVMKINHIAIYFYDSNNTLIKQYAIYKDRTTLIELTSDVALFGVYAAASDVNSTGTVVVELKDNDGLFWGLKGDIELLRENTEGLKGDIELLRENTEELKDEIFNVKENQFTKVVEATAQLDSSKFARFEIKASGTLLIELDATSLSSGYIERIYVYYKNGSSERIIDGLKVSGVYKTFVDLKEEITQVAAYAPQGIEGESISATLSLPLKPEIERTLIKTGELNEKINHSVVLQTEVNYVYLHKLIDFKLKKGAKIINKGLNLIIASDISLSDRYDIPSGGSYILDTDKEFLSTAGTTGKVDFEYEVYPAIEEFEELKSSIGNLLPSIAEVVMPPKIYAVVGDTLQLFYRGMIQSFNPYQYDILVACSKGKQYPRYFEFTPTADDIGEYKFTLYLKNDSGIIVSQGETTIKVVATKPAPDNLINIACFGDSLTSGGVWCKEANRRLTESGGFPQGLSLNNIAFVGTMQNGNTNYFGQGGWRWSHYVSAGASAFRFFVQNAGALALDDIYEQNGHDYQIKEINITNGTGNILCTTDENANPSASGALLKKSGNGDSQITYTSRESDARNPLWDTTQNKMTFIPYANEVANGRIDMVYVLLGWNDVHRESYPYPNMMADCKTFLNTLHSEFPAAKVKLMGLQVCSVNGGMGANYGATGTAYADTYGTIRKVMELNAAYKDLAKSSEYSGFVEYVDIASQFDSEYNMPADDVPVNTRSSTTERRGSNGVHPSTDGYMQIADAVFRNIVANL